MKHLVAEKRVQKRTEIDPFDMKYCLEFTKYHLVQMKDLDNARF
jgi:hypothetical protein